jgi:4-hydroxybenzoate polyprenyltransferase
MSTLTLQLPVYSPLFWRAYFIQMRPYLLFVSGIAGASGIAMQEQVAPLEAVISFIIFFFGYGFGQALTDCFQTDTDKLSAPYRPLSAGILSTKQVLTVSIIGLMLSAVILYLLNPTSFFLSCLAVFGLATYSYIKKHVWFAGPLYDAWIVALLPLMGFFAVAAAGGKSLPLSSIPNLTVTLFSYTSFVLIGYLKDISADKATGYRTFPVVWGWNKTMFAGDLVALVTLSFYWLEPHTNNYEIVVAVCASIMIIYAQLAGHFTKSKTEQGSLPAILATLRSFILFHIAIIVHFHPSWMLYAVVYFILFELTLHKRPSKYQV